MKPANPFVNECKFFLLIHDIPFLISTISMYDHKKFLDYFDFLRLNYQEEILRNCELFKDDKERLAQYLQRMEFLFMDKIDEVVYLIEYTTGEREKDQRHLDFVEHLRLIVSSTIGGFIFQQKQKYFLKEERKSLFGALKEKGKEPLTKDPQYQEAFNYYYFRNNPLAFVDYGRGSLINEKPNIKKAPGRPKSTRTFVEWLDHPKAKELADALKEKFYKSEPKIIYRALYEVLKDDYKWVKPGDKKPFFESMGKYFECEISSQSLYYEKKWESKSPEIFDYIRRELSLIKSELEE